MLTLAAKVAMQQLAVSVITVVIVSHYSTSFLLALLRAGLRA
jgi:hypothetical protein